MQVQDTHLVLTLFFVGFERCNNSKNSTFIKLATKVAQTIIIIITTWICPQNRKTLSEHIDSIV